MAKQIIVLERLDEPSDLNFNVAFWLVVPVTRTSFYVDSNKISQYKDISAQELSDLRAGLFIEKVQKVSYLSGQTLTFIRNDLQSRFTNLQNELNNQNPFVRYGTYFDGTSWTTGGVS